MIKAMGGYLRTCRNYLATAKGRHDTAEFLLAGSLILATALMVALVLRFGFGI